MFDNVEREEQNLVIIFFFLRHRHVDINSENKMVYRSFSTCSGVMYW